MRAHYAGYFCDADGRGRGNERDIRERSAFNAKAKASKKGKGDGVRGFERKWTTKLLDIICAIYIFADFKQATWKIVAKVFHILAALQTQGFNKS